MATIVAALAPKHIENDLVERAREILQEQISNLDIPTIFSDGWLKPGSPNREDEQFGYQKYDPTHPNRRLLAHDFPGRWPELSGSDEEFKDWPRSEPIVVVIQMER